MILSLKSSLQAWARQQLGVEESASQTAVRGAFLRRVGHGGLVPNFPVPFAFNVLTGQIRPTDLGCQNAMADLEKKLRSEIEVFARHFFQIDPRARQQRYQELLNRCESFPLHRARLQLLLSGLEFHLPPADEQNPVVELAHTVTRWFVLRPGDRARRRQDMIQKLRDRVGHLEVLIPELQARFPVLAQLGAEFLADISHSSTSYRAGDPYDGSPYRGNGFGHPGEVPDISLPAGNPDGHSQRANPWAGGSVWMWIVIFLLLARLLMALLN